MSSLERKRIVVTRGPGQADEFLELIASEGAVPIHVPTIQIIPPEDWSEVDRAIEHLASYDLIVFTSLNAATFFLGRVQEKFSTNRLWNKRVAAVGAATARYVESQGLEVTYRPSIGRGAGSLIVLLKEKAILSKQKILFPKALSALEILPTELRKEGADVDEVAVYRTEANWAARPQVEELLSSDVDWLTFASPSAVKSFLSLAETSRVQDWLGTRGVRIAAIGPTTTGALKEVGLPVAIEAKEATVAGMLAAMKEFDRDGSHGA